MPRLTTRRNEILAIFQKYDGQLSIPQLARYCWEEGVWSPEEQLRMGFRDAKRQCQDVLQTKDRQGLPLAGPSPQKEGNARVWVQLSVRTTPRGDASRRGPQVTGAREGWRGGG
jgi:hypothetical protein